MRKTEQAEKHITEAISYALEVLGEGSVISPRGMMVFKTAIDKYVSREIYQNKPFKTASWGDGDDQMVHEAAYEYVLIKINQARMQSEDYDGLDSQTAIAHYGPWVVNQDGTVDYGGNEVYHHKPTWHENEHHLSHMMTKVWLQNTAGDYLRALAHSAKIQGVKLFTVNVERIRTEQ